MKTSNSTKVQSYAFISTNSVTGKSSLVVQSNISKYAAKQLSCSNNPKVKIDKYSYATELQLANNLQTIIANYECIEKKIICQSVQRILNQLNIAL